jgi:hypothetical protein
LPEIPLVKRTFPSSTVSAEWTDAQELATNPNARLAAKMTFLESMSVPYYNLFTKFVWVGVNPAL